MLTPEQIMSASTYRDIFPSDHAKAKALRAKLLNHYHPDKNDIDTSAIFVQINTIYELGSASSLINRLQINSLVFEYDYSIVSKLYQIWYNRNSFLIQFSQKGNEFASNFKTNFDKLSTFLSGHHLRDRYTDLLQMNPISVATDISSGNVYYRLKMPNYYIPLNKLLEYVYEYKDWKICGYIISRLFDSIMLFCAAGLSYTGTDIDFIYVDTVNHKIIDLSAFFFSKPERTPLIGLTSFQKSCFTNADVVNKYPSLEAVNSQVYNLALILFGDVHKTGNLHLLDETKICRRGIEIIKKMNTSRPTQELYRAWLETDVISIFNERSFYKKEIGYDDLKSYFF